MGEELSECVCSGDCAWGLGGRHEERDLWILSVPKGVPRCMSICLSRERTGLALYFFFNSWTAVLDTVPYTDRFVMTVIDGYRDHLYRSSPWVRWNENNPCLLESIYLKLTKYKSGINEIFAWGPSLNVTQEDLLTNEIMHHIKCWSLGTWVAHSAGHASLDLSPSPTVGKETTFKRISYFF